MRMTPTVPRAAVVAVRAANNMPFEFELKRSRRRTLSLEVRAGKLIVRSPLFLSSKEILKFIEAKSSWVEEKIKKTQSVSNNPSFDQIIFLGEKYSVIIDGNKGALINNKGRKICLDNSDRSMREAIKMFYVEQTKKIVESFIDRRRYDFPVQINKIRYKFYRGKWGSCSARNNLSFNAYLSFAPLDVIDYVVVHELCHTIIKNHSSNYWDLVSKYCPEFKRQRKYLKNNNIIVL